MNALASAPTDPLPILIDRATRALDSARTSAEVLEARDIARVAYDAARVAARFARAKQAHDSIMAEVHRSQGHALAIRSRAEMRMAEEYDAAQPEEAKKGGRPKTVPEQNGFPKAADLGISRKDVHEARRLRDAERAEPGIIGRTIESILDRGEEPTSNASRNCTATATEWSGRAG